MCHQRGCHHRRRRVAGRRRSAKRTMASPQSAVSYVLSPDTRLTPAGKLTMVAWIKSGGAVAHVAAQIGISRTVAWRRCFRDEGSAGLCDRLSIARSHPRRTCPCVETWVRIMCEPWVFKRQHPIHHGSHLRFYCRAPVRVASDPRITQRCARTASSRPREPERVPCAAAGSTEPRTSSAARAHRRSAGRGRRAA